MLTLSSAIMDLLVMFASSAMNRYPVLCLWNCVINNLFLSVSFNDRFKANFLGI